MTGVTQSITVDSANPNVDEHKTLRFDGPDSTDLITITFAGNSFRIRGADLREAVRRMT